jgi:hypothetical protein
MWSSRPRSSVVLEVITKEHTASIVHFYLEDGSDKFLQNVSNHLQDYMTS